MKNKIDCYIWMSNMNDKYKSSATYLGVTVNKNFKTNNLSKYIYQLKLIVNLRDLVMLIRTGGN